MERQINEENLKPETPSSTLKETLKMENYWRRWKPAERNIPRGLESSSRLENIENVNKNRTECDENCFIDRREPLNL